MKIIDPHVHLRDWDQSDAETLFHAFSLAKKLGIGALFEMPNTVPPLTTTHSVLQRIQDADRARAGIEAPSPFHGLYIGITDDPQQIKEAVQLHHSYFPRVVGLKLYAGHSTGNMGMVTTAQQSNIWNTLARENYRGVVAVHAESEDLLSHATQYTPTTEEHLLNRPELAEIVSIHTQITLAEIAGFSGTMNIVHASTAESIALVHKKKDSLPFSLHCAVTPHHSLLDVNLVAKYPQAVGTYLVNPPLRTTDTREKVHTLLCEGKVDWIESDHAPHSLVAKQQGASGLPGLAAFRLLAETLYNEISFLEWEKLCGLNVCRIFGIAPDLIPDTTICAPHSQWDVSSPTFIRDIWSPLSQEYSYDPYLALLQ